jgi:hypothetical protein
MKAALRPIVANALNAPHPAAMLPPGRAWKLLCQRTGVTICLATFYRWLNNGKVYSVRLGFRIYVPVTALEHLIEKCLTGESLY